MIKCEDQNDINYNLYDIFFKGDQYKNYIY